MRHVWETEEVLAGFWWRNPRERENLKERVLHGMVIIKWDLSEVRWVCVDWIDLVQVKNSWRALVQ
jgi:hypothetical protein